ncbi:MAG: GMC oxidoreductase [Alcanivoracaceae bacterium]|nr:GMC oxidoreductase [Alcanivoracaceae bacterium]
MFYNGFQITDGNRIRTKVCIIGAGVAGITAALALSEAGISVALVESGGLERDAENQSLNIGNNTGLDYLSPGASRLRVFGGTSQHWTGWTRELDDIDFTKKDWIPDSGWPIKKSDLRGHYDQAAQILDLGPKKYTYDFWERLAGKPRFFNTSTIETALIRHSLPTRFGIKYKDTIEKSNRIHCFLNSNLVNLELSKDNHKHIISAHFKTLKGNTFKVEAQHYVLATGGIENARILLNCNTQIKAGLANSSGNVGRYFADHEGSYLGRVAIRSPLINPKTYRTSRISGPDGFQLASATPALKLTEEETRKLRLPNFAAAVIPYMGHDVRWGTPIDAPLGHKEFDIYGSIEPEPCRDSTVSLSDDRDPLGTRRVNLSLAFTRNHSENREKVAYEFARHLSAADAGRVQINVNGKDRDSLMEGMDEYGFHHMGTTRMHENRRHGVVNSDCRSHDISNLYIGGSSVFPTFGYAQPTLTIVALALRIAEHLAITIKASP